MKQFKKVITAVMAFAFIFSLFAGQAILAHEEEYSLEDWDGQWNNILYYFDHEELAEELDELAEIHEMKTHEYIAHEREESVPFDRLEIDGEKNTITFILEVPVEEEEDTEGKMAHELCPKMKAEETVEYKYTGSEAFEHAGATHYWRVFEAVEEDATYPVVFLMEIHGEEALAHFHIRVGTDAKLLAEDEGWWPTFVEQDTPLGLVKEEMMEHAEAHEH